MRERFRPSQTRIKATSKSSGGINAATTDSSVCNTQPTPQFSTAGANYQGKKIEKIEHDNLHQPVDGSSSKSHEEAHDNRKKDSALEPDP